MILFEYAFSLTDEEDFDIDVERDEEDLPKEDRLSGCGHREEFLEEPEDLVEHQERSTLK